MVHTLTERQNIHFPTKYNALHYVHKIQMEYSKFFSSLLDFVIGGK